MKECETLKLRLGEKEGRIQLQEKKGTVERNNSDKSVTEVVR
jgi:hypothetical protein